MFMCQMSCERNLTQRLKNVYLLDILWSRKDIIAITLSQVRQLARNPVFHARTKHIEVHYHFLREKVLAGEIDLASPRTKER